MKVVFLIGLLAASNSSFAIEELPAARTRAAVIAADNAWGQAEQDGNSQFVEHLLLDGYKSVGSSGKITTKAHIVEGSRKRGKSADYAKMVSEWKKKHPSEADVTIFGDTAVLTWVPTDAGSAPPVNSSDIFVYRDGEWRAIYSQHSTAPEKSR